MRVPNLQLLPAGSNYILVGQTTWHPVGWYGTATTIQGLQDIADDYQAMFYTSTPPSSERLNYNDLSLVKGGKFELNHNWCTSCSHSEHKEGLNCDVYSANVAPSRWPALTAMFVNNGSPNYLDETAAANHWHLRF